MFEGEHESFANSLTQERVVNFVKSGLVMAESNSVRKWLDNLKEDEFTALAQHDDSDFLENDQLLSERY